MCLSGIKYYINLRSNDSTLVKPQTTGEYLHKFDFNWNSFLRDIPHEVKYFKAKVNFFWKLKHGIDTNCVAVYCQQMESPYMYSFPREIGNPICYARPFMTVDVDDTADERMRNTSFISDSSTSDGMTVCIIRDAFIEISVLDPTGFIDANNSIAQYKDAGGALQALEHFNVQLVLEPYLETDKKESGCQKNGIKQY